jgi:uroporphyrinogen-III decarboxylase
MAMMSYFNAFGGQNALLRSESGTVSAIAGILKAPFDILADKRRGYLGLTMDVIERPKKVLAACEALAPHLLHVAKTSADPAKQVPIGFWMHRGCVPFVSPQTFDSFYWPTLRPIIEELWRDGRQTLFYAEGNWSHHLGAFAELPERSIVYHVDQGDIFEVQRALGGKFCLSGGVPNFLLSYGSAKEVRDCCRRVIDGVAADGGYIMDASAIMQNDTNPENLRAMTDFTREYGVYSSGHSGAAPLGHSGGPEAPAFITKTPANPRAKPGVCVPWEEKAAEMPPITGDETIVREIWQSLDELGYTYIWQCLLSF